jgi:hypothetical protein
MTPEKRNELIRSLNDTGMTVLLTRDYASMLLQLARLSQFERLMVTTAAGNPAVEFAVDNVHRQQMQIAGASQ